MPLCLRAVNKKPLAVRFLELLLAGLASNTTEYKLTPQLPLQRNAPLLCSLLVDDGVVVLKVGAKAFGLESHPQCKLVHGVGVL